MNCKRFNQRVYSQICSKLSASELEFIYMYKIQEETPEAPKRRSQGLQRADSIALKSAQPAFRNTQWQMSAKFRKRRA